MKYYILNEVDWGNKPETVRNLKIIKGSNSDIEFILNLHEVIVELRGKVTITGNPELEAIKKGVRFGTINEEGDERTWFLREVDERFMTLLSYDYQHSEFDSPNLNELIDSVDKSDPDYIDETMYWINNHAHE